MKADASEMVGKEFGYWTVVDAAPPDRFGTIHWKCVCRCGKERTIAGTKLRCGRTTSCKACAGIKRIKTHCKRGHPRTPDNTDKFGQCKECRNMRSVLWGKKYPKRRQSTQLKSSYGVTLEDLNVMLEEQNNCCAICHKTFSGAGKAGPHVDHVHDETKKVRELLCHKCNILIAYAFESVNILQSAIAYLKKHQEGGVCA